MQQPCLGVLAKHPDVCLFLQPLQKECIFSCGGFSCCADGNHSGYGYLSFHRMCGCYIFFCIPVCPWQPVCKGGYPRLVSYKCNVRRKNRSIYHGMDRNPLSYRPVGSATCTGCGRCRHPSIPSGIRPGRQACRQCQCLSHQGWILACRGYHSGR